MPPKERRKGKKEIHKENSETLNFYIKFVIAGTASQCFHILLSYAFSSEFSRANYFFVLLAVLVHAGCYYSLKRMATPYLGPNGELLEAGSDLSETYFAEYAIDFIILTTGIQILSAISNYMWFLWLLGPAYLVYKLWTSLLWPWFTSGPPASDTEDKRKHRHKKPKLVN